MHDSDPNDPLWKLLGQARPVEPRGDFVQNVLRQARQTPQQRGLWAWLTGWWQDASEVFSLRPALLVAAAVAMLTVVGEAWLNPEQTPDTSASAQAVAPVIELNATEIEILAENMAEPLASLDHLDSLLANADSSSLSDSDIAMLLY